MVKTTLDEWINMYFDRETEARDGAGPAGTALSSVDKFRDDEEIATAWAAPRDEGHMGIRKHLLNMVDTEDRGCSSESNLVESLSSAMSRAIRRRAIDGVLERALAREAHEADAAERQMRLCGIDDEAPGAASGEKKTQPSGSAWMLAAAPYMAPASRVRLLAELAESSRDRLLRDKLRELAQCSRERLLRELQLDNSSQGGSPRAR
jgi:hypothetical protein